MAWGDSRMPAQHTRSTERPTPAETDSIRGTDTGEGEWRVLLVASGCNWVRINRLAPGIIMRAGQVRDHKTQQCSCFDRTVHSRHPLRLFRAKTTIVG